MFLDRERRFLILDLHPQVFARIIHKMWKPSKVTLNFLVNVVSIKLTTTNRTEDYQKNNYSVRVLFFVEDKTESYTFWSYIRYVMTFRKSF